MVELNAKFGVPLVDTNGNLVWQASERLTIMAKPKITDEASLMLYIISVNTVYDCMDQLLTLAPNMVPESLFMESPDEEKNRTWVRPTLVPEQFTGVVSISTHPRFRSIERTIPPHGTVPEQEEPQEPA